jgi:hypothetical protein
MKTTEIINNSAYQLTVTVEFHEHLDTYEVSFHEAHADDHPPESKKTFFLNQEQYMRLKVLAL